MVATHGPMVCTLPTPTPTATASLPTPTLLVAATMPVLLSHAPMVPWPPMLLPRGKLRLRPTQLSSTPVSMVATHGPMAWAATLPTPTPTATASLPTPTL